MKRITSILLVLVMVLSLAACGSEPKSSSNAEGSTAESLGGGPLAKTVNLNAVAGGTSGSWYQTLAAMSELINSQNYGLIIKVMPGGGLSNPVTINTGEFQFGWTHSVLAKAAVAGSNPFSEKTENLRTLATSFNPHMLQITATQKSGYTSLDEIFEKHLPARFCTGNQSTITGWMFTEMLAYYKVTEKDIESWGGKVIYTGYGDWVTLAQDDQIDVMFDIIGVPASTTLEILTTTPLNFIEISDEFKNYLKTEKGFVDCAIPASLYNGLEKDVPTVGAGIELSVNKDVEDATVYAILECLEKLNPDIVKIHSSVDAFDISKAWENAGAELHPAAAQFYKDRGYMK